MRLANRVAIVTGASRGIGQAVAEAFARQGARVIVVGAHDPQAAEETVEALRRGGAEAMLYMADVSVASQVEALVAAVHTRFGRIDILVNNAGVIETGPLSEISDERWQRVIQTHLTGAFACTRAVAPIMTAQRAGRIINVTAPSALHGSRFGVTDYATAKGGIIAFTRNAAVELAPAGVTVNCVLPVAQTRMVDALLAYRNISLERYLRGFPLGRMPTLEEVAGVFVFFASDDAAMITGQMLAVDGGLSA